MALEWQTPPSQSCDGGQGSRGLTVEGPGKPTDKRQLTMGLSVRGSPNWFVSGTNLTGRGGAGVAGGTGEGPGVCVSQRTWRQVPSEHVWGSQPLTPSVFVLTHTHLDIFTHIETSHSHLEHYHTHLEFSHLLPNMITLTPPLHPHIQTLPYSLAFCTHTLGHFSTHTL